MSIIVEEDKARRIYFKLFNYSGDSSSFSLLLPLPPPAKLARHFEIAIRFKSCLETSFTARRMTNVAYTPRATSFACLSFISGHSVNKCCTLCTVIYELRKNNFNCAIKSTINFQSIITTTTTTIAIAIEIAIKFMFQLQSKQATTKHARIHTHTLGCCACVCVCEMNTKKFEYGLNLNRKRVALFDLR